MADIHPFDLQARIELGIRNLTALLDTDRPGQMYFLVNWRTRPPRADHCLWDCGDGSGRHIDALTLARIMVKKGSPELQRSKEEEAIERWMFQLLGEDGLSWLPNEPWAQPWGTNILLVDWHQGERAAEISWAQRGTLLALVSRYRATGESLYLRHAKRMVDALLAVAMRHPDGLFYPEGYYRTGGWRYQQPHLHPGIEEYNAATAIAAVRLYEASGYEPALDLAKGLIDFTLRHATGYTPDGAFRPPQGELEGHFHTRTNFILSVLKLGLVLKHPDYIDWARQYYEHAKTYGTDFGWFPEGLFLRHGEVCCFTDMIEMALLLAKHVSPHYYADAERFGRNQLLESQFLSLERLQQAVERIAEIDEPPPWDGRFSRYEGVTESQFGGFASRSTLNDAFHLDAPALMQCCNAAGVRALYDLWRYALEETFSEGTLQVAVHLRFSIESPSVRVISYEPCEGRIDIHARRLCRVTVRLPAGVEQALVKPTERPVYELQAQSGYISLTLQEHETVSVHYPLPERIAHYEVGTSERPLRCTGYWRGETLMRVEPAGIYYPLYQRSSDMEPAQPARPAGNPIESL